MSDYREPYLPLPGTAMDSHSIEANNQTIMRQAAMTADEYLHSAIDHIDDRLGKGYAKQHPELIAAFMQTAAADESAALIARAIETLARAVETKADEIGEQIAQISAHLEGES